MPASKNHLNPGKLPFRMKFLKDGSIRLDKVVNNLDKLAIDFTSILNELGIKHVIISGYVAILFGRNRASEDIDIITEHLEFSKFKKLWDLLYKKFECHNTENAKDAYETYLITDHAIRFCYKGEFIPNIEIKFPKTELDKWTLGNRKKAFLGKNLLFISQLELQVSFKLFLGSEKDIEDAKYIYSLFKGKLDKSLLEDFNRKLKIQHLFNRYLK